MTDTPPLRQRPGVLCILDGWGWRPEAADNAIAVASKAGKTPNFDHMLADSPFALLSTSGRAVGLPDGQMGNSEVGHMNMGAGRVVMQDLPRIDDAITDGSLAARPVLQDLIEKARAAQGAVHVMGLLSPGGVHSHQAHIAALVRIVADAGVPVFIHAFLDGRDTPPKSALGYLEDFEAKIAGLPGVRMATVSGRFYAMDRDKRWDRVAKTCDAIVSADGARFENAKAAVEAAYAENVTDEFVIPCVIGDYAGASDADALLFANFRADRARELSLALLDPHFSGFERPRVVAFAAAAGLTEYSDALNTLMGALYPADDIRDTLGEYVASLGLTQLRIAETEKYAHVTFFLNGGREAPFAGEDRILVPSPKIATYDQQPEMSAFEVTSKLEAAILSG
ncbi:MAG TPA: 2,3-bisphosphoglycerate-independent phosphoglycerate mutase, partial [Rhizomicrobium sp.]|nr:2,3-bisphosphoglycerate-independent phosphoglycerate mutase [Rhizomicrobium sp.]